MNEPDRTDLFAWARYLKTIDDDLAASQALGRFRDHCIRAHGEQMIHVMESHFGDIVHSAKAQSLLMSFQAGRD